MVTAVAELRRRVARDVASGKNTGTRSQVSREVPDRRGGMLHQPLGCRCEVCPGRGTVPRHLSWWRADEDDRHVPCVPLDEGACYHGGRIEASVRAAGLVRREVCRWS